jgi:hypothetical protein
MRPLKIRSHQPKSPTTMTESTTAVAGRQFLRIYCKQSTTAAAGRRFLRIVFRAYFYDWHPTGKQSMFGRRNTLYFT